VAAAFRARHNRPIGQALTDPVGQPLRHNHEFLNRFVIFHLALQDIPRKIAPDSFPIG